MSKNLLIQAASHWKCVLSTKRNVAFYWIQKDRSLIVTELWIPSLLMTRALQICAIWMEMKILKIECSLLTSMTAWSYLGNLHRGEQIKTCVSKINHIICAMKSSWSLPSCISAMQCPANSKYVRCMQQCQPTCGDPTGNICKRKRPFLLGENCVEGTAIVIRFKRQNNMLTVTTHSAGCRCNSGYTMSNDKCVRTERCGCLVDGVYYEKGMLAL